MLLLTVFFSSGGQHVSPYLSPHTQSPVMGRRAVGPLAIDDLNASFCQLGSSVLGPQSAVPSNGAGYSDQVLSGNTLTAPVPRTRSISDPLAGLTGQMPAMYAMSGQQTQFAALDYSGQSAAASAVSGQVITFPLKYVVYFDFPSSRETNEGSYSEKHSLMQMF